MYYVFMYGIYYTGHHTDHALLFCCVLCWREWSTSGLVLLFLCVCVCVCV